MEIRHRSVVLIIAIIFLSRSNGLDLIKTVSEDLPELLKNEGLKLPGGDGLSDNAMRMRMFMQLIRHSCQIFEGLDQANMGLQLAQNGLGDLLKDPVKNLGGGVDKVGKGAQQWLGGSGQALQGAGGIGADGVKDFLAKG